MTSSATHSQAPKTKLTSAHICNHFSSFLQNGPCCWESIWQLAPLWACQGTVPSLGTFLKCPSWGRGGRGSLGRVSHAAGASPGPGLRGHLGLLPADLEKHQRAGSSPTLERAQGGVGGGSLPGLSGGGAETAVLPSEQASFGTDPGKEAGKGGGQETHGPPRSGWWSSVSPI